MKVHLIKTNDYSDNDLLKVHEFLKTIHSPISFLADTINLTSYFNFLNAYSITSYNNIQLADNKVNLNSIFLPVLTWDQIFQVCNKYREIKQVLKNDIVVLLTNRANNLNWFSCFDLKDRNIFVHTAEWENFITCHHLYPVAHEILSNILYILKKLEPSHLDSYVHLTPLGCFNDFCRDKTQVALKLRTGDICKVCLKNLQQENVDPLFITYVLRMFEIIREQTLFRNGFITRNIISRLKVTEEFKILLIDFNNIEICLTPRQKALYFLFLKHLDGIRFAELIDYKQEILKYYIAISAYENIATMQKSIDILCEPGERETLNTECARIKRQIKKKINFVDNSILEKYIITGKRDEKKRITLNSSYIELPF